MTDADDLSPSFRREVPPDDDMERSVCTRCGFVDYENPKIVVGAVATDPEGRILLCRRAIEPRKGWWTIPAGYLELNETPMDGARREAREEAGANLQIDRLLATYTVARISQVQLIYRATLLNPDTIEAGPESQEIALVAYEDIPWTELAFPTVAFALRDFGRMRGKEDFAPCTNPEGGL